MKPVNKHSKKRVGKEKNRIPKERIKKSWVWTHFEKDKVKSSKLSGGDKYVNCSVDDCDISILIKGANTSQMSRHLENYHKLFPENKKQKGADLNDDDSTEVFEIESTNSLTREEQEALDLILYVSFILLFEN